jgi:NADP-dependent 3-hydroxy acid dehydrogenase YdfG
MNSATRRHFLAAGAAFPVMAAAAAKQRRDLETCRGLLAGKTAVIYGAAGDIGSGVSRAFAAEGAHVCLVGRTLEKVEALAKSIAASGGSAEAARIDAYDIELVEQHLRSVVATRGRVDISFNLVNLGGAQGQVLTEMAPAAFAEPVFNAMRTQFITGTAAGRHMVRQKGGVILALTAQVARKPYTTSGGFGVACAAIEALNRQLAIELGPSNVRVVTLRSSGSPDAAGVAAAIGEHARAAGVSLESFKARIADVTMLKRMPLVAEIASAAVIMASDRASAVTAAVANLTCGEIAD